MNSSESTQPATLSQESKKNHKAKRGVLYIIWGNDERAEKEMKRSIVSVQQQHPDIPMHVERFEAGSFLTKSKMYDLSPFEETAFLDNDTVILGRLDFAFDKARKFSLACCINECPWARRYSDKQLSRDMIEYNTGVLFFTRSAKPFFDAWAKLSLTVDTSIIHYINGKKRLMPIADQGSFALAIEKTGFLPFILPLNWNFRPIWHKSFFGPIKIWHDHSGAPPAILKWNENQASQDNVIQYNELISSTR